MKSFIQYFFEKRKNPEVNIKHYSSSFYEKIKDEKGWFLSFTSLDKLGLNPVSKYNTPLGLYCYLLEDYQEEIEDRNGFVGAFPFLSTDIGNNLNFFSLKPNASILDFYSDEVSLNGELLSLSEIKQQIQQNLEPLFQKRYSNSKQQEYDNLLERLDQINEKIKKERNDIILDIKENVLGNKILNQTIGGKRIEISFLDAIESITKEYNNETFFMSNLIRHFSSKNIKTFNQLQITLTNIKTEIDAVMTLIKHNDDQIKNYKLLNNIKNILEKKELDISLNVSKSVSIRMSFFNQLKNFISDNFNQSFTVEHFIDYSGVSLDTLKELRGKLKDKSFKQVLTNFEKEIPQDPHFEEIRRSNPEAYYLWNTTRLLAALLYPENKIKFEKDVRTGEQKKIHQINDRIVGWNQILRKCFDSVDIINDHGIGLIHPNEPKQSVILNTLAIDKKSIKRFKNVEEPKFKQKIQLDSYSSFANVFTGSLKSALNWLSTRTLAIGVTNNSMKTNILNTLKRYTNDEESHQQYEINYLKIISDPDFLFNLVEANKEKLLAPDYFSTSQQRMFQKQIVMIKNKEKIDTPTWFLQLWFNTPGFKSNYEEKHGTNTTFHQLIEQMTKKE